MNMNVIKHLDMLGRQAEDRVTGFKGVVSSIYFDLYGCIQAVVTPRAKDDGGETKMQCFDVARLIITGEPVMERPDWEFGPAAEGKHGPAEKPGFEQSHDARNL